MTRSFNLVTTLLLISMLFPAVPALAQEPLAAPTNLAAAVISDTQVDLTWTDNSDNEAGFRVERSVDGITFADVGTPTTANATAFSDTTVVLGTTYYYRVIVFNTVPDSATSNVSSITVAVPDAPSDLTAIIMSATRVDLIWTDQSNNETNFRIERSLDNFATAPSATLIAVLNQRTFSDTTVSISSTYSYRVIAVNAIGDSAPSNMAMVTVTGKLQIGPIDPDSIYPDAPADVQAGLPGYYQDDEGTRLTLLPITGNGLSAPTQIYDDPDLTNPYSVFLGYGTEAFYFYADNVFNMPNGGLVKTVFGIEEAFGGAGDAVPGQEFVFARTRIRIDVPIAGTYKVFHPYDGGTPLVFDVTTPGRRAINYTSDIGLLRNFSVAANANITRFLHQANPPTGWIGDGTTIGPVTGSPTGFNKVRIEGPPGSNLGGPGVDFAESDQFVVSGRLLPAVIPLPSFNVSLDPASGAVPNAANFTDTSTGTPIAWLWNFGDGTTSTIQNPTKTYDAAGNYLVTLTVTNPAGTVSTSRTLNIYGAMVASFTHTAPNSLPPVTINFTDTSTGTPASRVWDFGDGTTSVLQNPSHAYAAEGIYTVRLTVTNPVGSAFTEETISISANLIAGFTKTLDPATGITPVTVTFTDNSTGTITGWLWNFGDGTTIAVQNPPPKIYSVAGNINVTLTVTDAAGSASTSQMMSVFGALTANFTKSAANGPSPLTVSFSDTSDGNSLSWLWDFGDGTTSTLQNPTKTYTTFGRYTVTLTVTNPAGSAAVSQVVTVSTVNPATLKLQVGPIDPNSIYQGNLNTGWPSYYEDDQGTRVGLLPITAGQIFDSPVTGNDYSEFLGFGTEAFYWVATTVSDTSVGRIKTVFGIEGAFGGLGDAVPGEEFVFARTRIVADVPVAGTYTFEHPYGTETITVTADDVASRGIFFTSDIGVPRDFLAAAAANNGNISRFLRPVLQPAPGWLGVGDMGSVTGSPTGFNKIRLMGPADSNLGGPGIDFVETDQFRVFARLFTSLVPGFTVSFNPANGVAPVSANFTDTTTGDTPTSWLWNFGDDTTSTVQNPFKTYTAAGTFTVTLTVTNAAGTASTFQIVSVFGTLTASFTKSAASGTAPLTIAFTDTSTGVPASWLWNFGDGTTSTVQNPFKTYTAAGTFTVTLTVTSAAGTASTFQSVTVIAPAQAPPVDGGVTTPTVRLDGLTLTTTNGLAVDVNGIVLADARVTTKDGKTTLDIPAGTRLRNKDGTPVTALTAAPTASPPSPPIKNTVVLATDFGPDGANFNPPLTLSMNYAPAMLPSGTREEKLRIAFWDGTKWIKLNSIVSPATKTITAEVSHFTTFAMLVEEETLEPTPAPTPIPVPTPTPVPPPALAPQPAPAPHPAPAPQPNPTAPLSGEINPLMIIGIVAAALFIGATIFVVRRRKNA